MGITTQRGGTGGASKSLSNLVSVSINTSLNPDGNGTRVVGIAGKFWKEGCFNDIVGPTVFNEVGANVDFRFEGDTEPNLLFLDASADKVGIGTSSPNAQLDVTGTPGASVGGFASGQFHVTSPSTAVNANAVITGHNSNSGNKQLWYIGSASSSNDSIGFINRQNSSLFLSTNNTARLHIEPDGNVGIGTTNPQAQLYIDQSSTTGAEPVLYLDQADISEEMIEFNTTIGVGNAIEAVGAKTLTTTHFIKITLPGSLTRYIPVGTIA